MKYTKSLFIDGTVQTTDDRYDVANPFSGEVAAEVSRASQGEIERAITSAGQAYSQTHRFPRARRVELLEAMVQGIAARRGELELAITQCTGKPIIYARNEVTRTLGVFRLAAEEVKRFGGNYEPLDFDPTRPGAMGLVERFSIGPVTGIGPFNFPLNLISHKVAPAIATGNPIIIKPPPQCPAPAVALAEIATKAGAPAGAVNVISAEPEVAERLVTDERIKMVLFTGSTKVGWALKAKAGRKRVTLELGGNGGLIIDEGVELKDAAQRAARGAFVHAGQVCLSVQRIFVHRAVYDQFLKLFVDETKRFPTGDPMEERTLCGPLVNKAAADRVMEWIEEARKAGAEPLCGAKQTGAVITPAVIELNGPSHHRLRVWSEEVFGPVATIERVDSFEQAVRDVNDSRYGLQAGVFTNNLEHAMYAFRELEVGGVIIGETGVFRVDSYPFGGIKESGSGREGVRYAMESMTEPRMLVLNLPHLATHK